MTTRDFLLPDLGEGLEDAEVVQWLVAEGDRVELNQNLVEVNTAKATVELPSPWAGVVERLHAAAGDVVEVGRPLVSVRVDDAPEAAPADAAPAGRRPVLVGYGVDESAEAPPTFPVDTPPRDVDTPPRDVDAPAAAAGAAVASATPAVRKLAKDLGVDLSSLAGSGPGGRVTREDVERAAPGGGGAPGDDVEVVPVRGVRRVIAERLTASVREIPQVTTFITLDATALQAFRERLTEGGGERVSPLPIVVKALAETCAAHPSLNASFLAERSEIHVHRRVHVGVATDTERGLMVPVVRDVQEKGVGAVAADVARLVAAARDGSIGPDELTGGTITITNVGTFGAEYGTPIIDPPQGAILALGVIEHRALVVDGAVEARPACTLALTFDHRLLDGAQAGRAVRDLRDLLQDPSRLEALPR
jgi:2-oxoisovalerate dehydrogenase E2 component (dihydrolipoyl transacylase)